MRDVDDAGGFLDRVGQAERVGGGGEVEFFQLGFGGLSAFAGRGAVVALESISWECEPV